MAYQTLNVEESEDVTTVTLNRPERRNALNPQMIDELIQVMDDLAQRSAGVMILTGTGTAFCAAGWKSAASPMCWR
jgi:enoyl-CoA hydratase/carnithine racemase